MGSVAAAIRPATEDDVAALVALREIVAGEGRWIGRELPLPDDFADRIRESLASPAALTLVTDVDGVVVGDGVVHPDGAGLLGLSMALLPEHRGQGLGAALLDGLLAWARSRADVHKVTLQVWPHNEAAIAVYRSAGFQVEGYLHRHWRRNDGALWDAIVMGLPVDH